MPTSSNPTTSNLTSLKPTLAMVKARQLVHVAAHSLGTRKLAGGTTVAVERPVRIISVRPAGALPMPSANRVAMRIRGALPLNGTGLGMDARCSRRASRTPTIVPPEDGEGDSKSARGPRRRHPRRHPRRLLARPARQLLAQPARQLVPPFSLAGVVGGGTRILESRCAFMALGPTSPADPSPKPDASHDATPVLVATKQFSKQLAHGVHSAGWAIGVLQLGPLAHADAVPLRAAPKLRARISATTRKGGNLLSQLPHEHATSWGGPRRPTHALLG